MTPSFPAGFDEVFRSEGVRVAATPYRSPLANAVCERWIGSARGEGLDWLVVEIIPQHSQGVLFRTNNADSGGFIDPRTPAPGDHIIVTGPYVIDTNSLHRVLYQGRPAENWAEIHPAWAVKVDQPAKPGLPNQFGPEFGESG